MQKKCFFFFETLKNVFKFFCNSQKKVNDIQFKPFPGSKTGQQYVAVEFASSAGVTGCISKNGALLLGVPVEISVMDPAANYKPQNDQPQIASVHQQQQVQQDASSQQNNFQLGMGGGGSTMLGMLAQQMQPAANGGNNSLQQQMMAVRNVLGGLAPNLHMQNQGGFINIPQVANALQQSPAMQAGAMQTTLMNPVTQMELTARALTGQEISDTKLQQLNKTVHIGGLSKSVSENDVKDAMSEYGSVVKIRMDTSKNGDRFAICELDSEENAKNSLGDLFVEGDFFNKIIEKKKLNFV